MPEEENKIRETLEKLPKTKETTQLETAKEVEPKPAENKNQVKIPVSVEAATVPEAPANQEPEVEIKK